jgi:hypothetical protein
MTIASPTARSKLQIPPSPMRPHFVKARGGASVDEWSRLIRAYAALHEADKAKAALADARRALAPDPNAVASLDALAHDLGLGDAN